MLISGKIHNRTFLDLKLTLHQCSVSEFAMEILYALACDEQEMEIVYLLSNIPGPGPVFLTPLGKRLAYSKIIT